MQVSLSRSILRINKSYMRTVAANSAAINVTDDTKPLKSWQEIPGPTSLPIIGQLLHFLPGGEYSDLNKVQETLYKKYGPISKLDASLNRPLFVFLFDPETMAYVLRSENWMPIRPGFFSLEYYRRYHNRTKEHALRPTGLITDNGELWREVRTTVNPVMMQPKTIRLYAPVLAEVADDMITRLKSIRDKDNKITNEFDLEMNLWALESIGVVALGGRLNCFDPNLSADSPARQLIQCVHELFKLSNQLDFRPSFWKYYPTRTFKKAMKLYEEHENLAKYFVRKAMEELKSKNSKSDDEKGVLQKLLEINEEIAVIMACDMLFAGVDTAATNITAILYLLATNQEKQNKLRDEVTSKEESRRYTRACIKEAMRLMPVVSGNMRKTTKEYNLLGYSIPKDTHIVFNHQALSLTESQYPRAKEYIPERWLDKESPLYHGSAHPFSYSPFGFGVRMCIGRRIAELELETFLAKLIQNFKVEWEGPPPTVKKESLNYLIGPFNFTLKDL